jgi:integrase
MPSRWAAGGSVDPGALHFASPGPTLIAGGAVCRSKLIFKRLKSRNDRDHTASRPASSCSRCHQATSVAPLPRIAKGEVQEHAWKDGRTVSFWLRVSYKGKRVRVDLGKNHEGWTKTRAEVELERVMGQIERGTWTPPTKSAPAHPAETETLHVTASRWYQRKKKEGIEEKTDVDYRWRLNHLLAYQPHIATEEIDVRWVDDFREWMAGRKSERGKPFSGRAINMVLALLAMVLDDAVEYGLLPANPARGPRRRIKERKRRKRFLEPDMVVDLLDAAGDWEDELRENGQPHQCYGRRALLAMLILAGPRDQELSAARIADLDIHTGVLRVDRSKTEAGERDIDLTAYLLGEVRLHLARLPAIIGAEPTSETPIYPTRTGKRRSRTPLARMLTGAVKRANKKRAKRNKLLIPEELTPHDLRRTYACLCFWAGRQLPYVQAQIGHKDGRMTLDAYAYATKRERIDKKLVWELMHFPDEDEKAGYPSPIGIAQGRRETANETANERPA